jgi:LPXTG-site transpeptidase (sortase) family protein
VQGGKAGDRVAGLSKRLFVLFLAMVIAGFAIPSPGIAVRPGETAIDVPGAEYRSLDKPSAPVELIVPSIDLSANVIPIAVDDGGVLHPPEDVNEVGWWELSAKPGAKDGQTLLTGHTVHTGGGVMNRLGDLRPGDLVQIRTARGTLDYSTTKVFVYTRDQVSKNSQELFGQGRDKNRLVLVTCTGWTGSVYTSNIIVFADPVGVRVGTSTAPTLLETALQQAA